MRLPIFQLDAFADAPLKGNPAAVCPLETWLPDTLMQSIAEENNLAETAFYVGSQGQYKLRWFTPTKEVDLCGDPFRAEIVSSGKVMYEAAHR